MVRLYFAVVLMLLATSCQGQLPASGTLVAVVPANGGIVVAADTRSTPAQTYCDGQTKLFIPKTRKNMVVFQTGEGLQLPPPGAHMPADICGYVKSTAPLLDIANFLVQQVDARPERVLARTEMQEIAELCFSLVNTYRKLMEFTHLHALSRYVNQDMFRAAIVSYDVKHERGLFGSFLIRVDRTGTPTLGTVEWYEFLKTDNTADDVKYAGETAYVDQYVLKLGQQFLGPVNALFGKTVFQTSLTDATSAALSLITATEEIAKKVTPPHGIGGPIDVATITKAGVVLERH